MQEGEIIYRKVDLKRDGIPKIKEPYKIFDTNHGRVWWIEEAKTFSDSFEITTINLYRDDISWWLEPIPLSSILAEKILQISNQANTIMKLQEENNYLRTVDLPRKLSDLKSQTLQVEGNPATTHHRGSGGYEELLEWVEKQRSSPTKTHSEMLNAFKNKILSLSNQESKNGFKGNEEVFYEFLEFMRKEMHVDIQWNDKYVIGIWQDKLQSLTPNEKEKYNQNPDELNPYSHKAKWIKP